MEGKSHPFSNLPIPPPGLFIFDFFTPFRGVRGDYGLEFWKHSWPGDLPHCFFKELKCYGFSNKKIVLLKELKGRMNETVFFKRYPTSSVLERD